MYCRDRTVEVQLGMSVLTRRVIYAHHGLVPKVRYSGVGSDLHLYHSPLYHSNMFSTVLSYRILPQMQIIIKGLGCETSNRGSRKGETTNPERTRSRRPTGMMTMVEMALVLVVGCHYCLRSILIACQRLSFAWFRLLYCRAIAY